MCTEDAESHSSMSPPSFHSPLQILQQPPGAEHGVSILRRRRPSKGVRRRPGEVVHALFLRHCFCRHGVVCRFVLEVQVEKENVKSSCLSKTTPILIFPGIDTVCLACFAAIFLVHRDTLRHLDSPIKGLSFDVPYGLIRHRPVAHYLSIAFAAK